MPNITVKHCNTLNPTSLLPTTEEGEPHDCVATVSAVCSPKVDLTAEPLTNPVDESVSRDPQTGEGMVGFAVVAQHSVLGSGRLPSHLSA